MAPPRRRIEASLSAAAAEASHTTCRSEDVLYPVTFTWEIKSFINLRRIAAIKGLPCKDRLLSPQFGNGKNGGTWHIALFPYCDREDRIYVSVYLFSDNGPQVAGFKICLLNALGLPMPGTSGEEQPVLFTTEACSWGWHEFLWVDTEDDMKQYLVEDDLLIVHINLEVFTGIQEVVIPKTIFDVYKHAFDMGDTNNNNYRRSLVSGLISDRTTRLRQIDGTNKNKSDSNVPTNRAQNVRSYCHSDILIVDDDDETSSSSLEESETTQLTHHASFQAQLSALLDAESELLDTKIYYGDSFGMVSGLIASCRSPVVYRTLYGPLQRVDYIDLRGAPTKPAAEQFIKFLNHGCISDDNCCNIPDMLSLLELADSYLTTELYDHCVKHLIANISLENHAAMLRTAETLKVNILVQALRLYIV